MPSFKQLELQQSSLCTESDPHTTSMPTPCTAQWQSVLRPPTCECGWTRKHERHSHTGPVCAAMVFEASDAPMSRICRFPSFVPTTACLLPGAKSAQSPWKTPVKPINHRHLMHTYSLTDSSCSNERHGRAISQHTNCADLHSVSQHVHLKASKWLTIFATSIHWICRCHREQPGLCASL